MGSAHGIAKEVVDTPKLHRKVIAGIESSAAKEAAIRALEITASSRIGDIVECTKRGLNQEEAIAKNEYLHNVVLPAVKADILCPHCYLRDESVALRMDDGLCPVCDDPDRSDPSSSSSSCSIM